MGEANSDHLPVSMSINIKRTLSKKKNLCFTRKVIPSTEEIKGLLQNKNWLSVVDIEATKKICQKKLFIRATIKIQEHASQIFKNKSWKDDSIDLKAAMPETFKNYVKDLDLWRTYDSARFYRVVNSILNYKVRGKL